eukprot:SRR837773.20204.p1 GENE.SRR837773.20204~~SRR837773.20204.p1  ORF type:complete len:193 (-),score=53.63 SRR837773.20204:5-520(-)
MNWSVAEVASYLRDIGLSQYAAVAESNKIDGPTLLQLCRKSGGLEELGVASKLHASKLRAKLGTYDASSARKAGELCENSRNSSRNFSGPQLTPAHEVAEEHRRHEYIGCCGFPCRRGENGTHWEKDSDDEGPAAQAPSAAVEPSLGPPEAHHQPIGGEAIRNRAPGGDEN